MSLLLGLAIAALLAEISSLIGEQIGFVSPLIIAVVLGVLLGNTVGVPMAAAPGVQFAASKLLRFGVVLLGLRVALSDLLGIGAPGLIVVALSFTATFFGAQWLGKRMGVSPDLSLLVGTGYAICGVSAVAAMNAVIEADEEETAYAVGLVTLAGSFSIVVLPLIGTAVGLAGSQLGAWIGGSVHDVAQTVAAASTGGDVALAAAVVVKLTRVALLAPLVIGVTFFRRRHHLEAHAARRPPLLPGFVVGFLVAVLIRSFRIVPEAWLTLIKSVEGFLFIMALVGVGAGVNVGRLRKLGGAPVALGMVTWLIVAGISYLGVVITR
jgi:uncharacterized integral membrane protein (TIGR00698 family)